MTLMVALLTLYSIAVEFIFLPMKYIFTEGWRIALTQS